LRPGQRANGLHGTDETHRIGPQGLGKSNELSGVDRQLGNVRRIERWHEETE
jgi:hypothetical protein